MENHKLFENPRFIYARLWLVLILIPITVSATSFYGIPLFEFIDSALSTEWEQAWRGSSWWFKLPVMLAATAWISWKIVKLIIQGCPFVLVTEIMEDKKSNLIDRLMSLSCIGKWNSYAIESAGEEHGLWFGAIFSSHPKNDSLHKRRLILMIFALPNDWSLIISRGPVLLRKHDHRSRTEYFDTRITGHIKEKT